MQSTEECCRLASIEYEKLEPFERVKLAMMVRRVSVRALADQTGIPYPSLQNYFLKSREMPSGVVAKIATALDLSTDWIISGQPARLARETVADCLNLIEQMRGLSDHKATFDECAKMFITFYERFYPERFGSGAVDRAKLDVIAKPEGQEPRRRRPAKAQGAQ